MVTSDSGEAVLKKSYSIKVAKQPPGIVFSEEWFPVVLVIEQFATKAGKITGSSHDVHIISELTAFPYRNELSRNIFCSSASLLTNPEVIRLSFDRRGEKTKTMSIMCKIKSHIHENKATQCTISFSSTPTKSCFSSNKVSYARTTSIQIVSKKLVVDDKTWPDIWFKDEGGKDKCMEAKISLVDGFGHIIKGRRIPLSVTLLYDNEESTRVIKQDTLRILSPSPQFINAKSGECSISFRIEEVSKNHQGQNFKLEIAPDVPDAFCTAKVCTPPVCIRSKRNKRIRPTTSRRDTNEKLSTNSPTRPLGLASSKCLVDDSFTQDSSIDLSDIKNSKRLRQAMKSVIEWTEEIVHGLYQIKWNIIGYAKFSDGTLDYNRPYHSMQNPNEHIKKILSEYSDHTRCDLQTLRDTVENSKESKLDGLKLMALSQIRPKENFPFGNHQTPTETKSSKQSRMENSMQLPVYQVPQVPPSVSLTQGIDMQHPATIAHIAPNMIAQQNAAPCHFHQQKYLRERLTFQDQHMSIFDPEMRSRRFSSHNETDILMMNRSNGERELERLQDKKVDEEIDTETLQKTIMYILAKQIKSANSGQRLGFPAFNSKKIIVGFYRESETKVGVGRFVLLSKYKDQFRSDQMMQATFLLEDALKDNSEAVHCIQNYGSLQNMIGHALAYEWSKDLSFEDGADNSDHIALENVIL